jgi:hypothetical protein
MGNSRTRRGRSDKPAHDVELPQLSHLLQQLAKLQEMQLHLRPSGQHLLLQAMLQRQQLGQQQQMGFTS